MAADVQVQGGRVQTPAGSAPLIPILLIGIGGYLMWFSVRYFRGSGPAVWPSYPVKSVLQGKGIPPNSAAPTADTQLAAYEQAAGGAIEGSAGTGPLSGTTPAGYANPFARAQVTPNRIDQGVDYTGTGPIAAIGRATVLISEASGSGWPSGGYSGYVSYRLLEGPAQGKIVYVAEGVVPSVTAGEQVQAGQPVATFAPGSSIETGWASGDGTVSESATAAGGGIAGGGPFPTKLGLNFSQLLQALGAPGGTGGGQGAGQLPAGYPNWSRQQGLAGGQSPSGQPQNMARLLFPRFGWDASQFPPLVSLWTRESGWSATARNPSSGALGIAQALGHGGADTGGTLGNEYGAQYGLTAADARAANSGSVLQQVRWGMGYVKARYGTPSAALAHENTAGWY